MMCLKSSKRTTRYRWGIVGTGRMAHTFCKALSKVDGAEISAVYSRTLKKAQKFANSPANLLFASSEAILITFTARKISFRSLGKNSTPSATTSASSNGIIPTGAMRIFQMKISMNALPLRAASWKNPLPDRTKNRFMSCAWKIRPLRSR